MNLAAGPATVLGQMLEGRFVRLIATVPADYPSLYAIAFGDELGSRWLGPLAGTSAARFERAVAACHTRFTIKARGGGMNVGMVALHAVDLVDAHAKVGLLTIAVPEVISLAVQGAALAIEYAFAVLQLRKVYIEVPEGDARIPWDSLAQVASLEGRLVNHFYDLGRYRDLVLLAIYREKWEEAATPLLDAIQDLGG